ncbi:hypothetical protein BRD16_01690 [Halobacteriales archaeon SW_6_65_46]|nr:MAG: hypothetical protein BRD16_01690 [Halobacteriales archaeon SW_6_65_46]
MVSTFAVLGALWYFGVPAWLAYSGTTAVIVVPWFALVFGSWSWSRLNRRMNVHIQLDESGDRAGVVLLDRDEHRDAEIDGDRLPTRTGTNTNKTVYLSTGHSVEQREVTDSDGGTSTVARRIISTPWEGWVSPWEVAERWSAYEASVRYADDVLKEARNIRAELDIRSLEATDDAIHSVIKGAEKDQFVSDESDPFGHGLDRDLDADPGEPENDRAGQPVDSDPEPEAEPDMAADGGGSDE